MNQQPIFEIKEEDKKKNYGKFVITPLAQGYGNTLGNSLRRVLLTSLDGLAISTVKISGVRHQFQTLKGMAEDVVELSLNLKEVRLSSETEIKKPVKATLEVKGPGEVKAGDINVSSDVEVVNPELVLAKLNKGAKISANMTVAAGVGYSPAEDRKSKEIGLIALDASFSPVLRVNYKVEETRVGRLTDHDKLVIEIWTDGTTKPKEAIIKASKILIEYFNQIVSPVKVKKVKKEKEANGLGPVGNLSVEEISLPTRVANALVKAGFDTVEKLSKADKKDLSKVRNLGEKSIKIIEAALGEKGVKFEI